MSSVFRGDIDEKVVSTDELKYEGFYIFGGICDLINNPRCSNNVYVV